MQGVLGSFPIGIYGSDQGSSAARSAFDALSGMSVIGDTIYAGANGVRSILTGNTSATRKFMTMTGDGTNAAAPSWATIVAGDVPTLNQDTTGKSAKTDALNSATTIVNVSSAAAPSVGQALIATSSTTATWQGPSNGGGLIMIQQIITAASQATVDFTSIPTGYQDLEIRWQARSTNAVSTEDFRLRFNNDTTAADYNTSSYMVQGGTGTDAATAVGTRFSLLPGTSVTASYASHGTISIPNYLGTTYFKEYTNVGNFGQATAAIDTALQMVGTWKSTAAITRITLAVATAGIVNGSVFTLYGTPATAVTSLAGAFTNGSVLYASGNIASQDNANFFWDATNHRLGIGNAAPGVALDVTGAIKASTTLTALGATALGSTGQFGVTATGVFSSSTQPRSYAYSSVTQSLGNSAWVSLTMNTNTTDVGGVHSTSSNTSRFTVPTGGAGLWLFAGGVAIAQNNTGVYRAIRIFYNNTTRIGATTLMSQKDPTDGPSLHVSAMYQMADGDYVEFQAYQDSGGSLNTQPGGSGITWGSAVKIA